MYEEKKFIKPEAEVIEFLRDDVIATSGEWGEGNIGGTDGPSVP